MGAADTSAEGSGTQPGARDTSAKKSGTRREDKWGQRRGQAQEGALEAGASFPRPGLMCLQRAQEGRV
jgi:hypothetical protein